tara:strand:+ start:111 stop:929 length:819 start_codon:yes stop_codon:yes gene_type:complete
MGFVYMLTSPSKKRYIGITTQKSVEDRWKDHKKKHSHCTLLKRAIDKYGFDSFKKEVLVVTNNIYIEEYEQNFINVYDTLAPNGYNCTTGGELNKKLSEETKEKIGKTAKQNCLNIAKGSIQPNKKGHFHLRYGGSRKKIGTYQTRELAEKAFIIWKETGTVSEEGRVKTEEGRVKRGNGYTCKEKKPGRFRVTIRGKYLGTFNTQEYAQKAIKQWFDTKTVSEEGRIKINNGSIREQKSGRFSANKNHKNLGTFDSREDAQKAIDDYVKSL